jgi:4'-phosphopantetheinyl transferase
MAYTKRRTEYLLRRWAAKQAVAAVTGLARDPESLGRIDVRNAAGGAPEVYLDGVAWTRAVSLSDRAGWAVCVVGPDMAPIGCDLELVEPRSPGFLRDFLTDAEQRYVAGHNVSERHAAANLVWSAKESGLKTLGTGLGLDTRSVEVTAVVGDGAGWAPLSVRVGRTALPGWWRRDGVFIVTLAAVEAISPPLPLDSNTVLARAEPLHSWLGEPSPGQFGVGAPSHPPLQRGDDVGPQVAGGDDVID